MPSWKWLINLLHHRVKLLPLAKSRNSSLRARNKWVLFVKSSYEPCIDTAMRPRELQLAAKKERGGGGRKKHGKMLILF
jgi:hypothetical protein